MTTERKTMKITIPPAALEAGARAAHDMWRKQASAGDDIAEYEQWDDLSRFYKDELRDQARAALEAMVEAWPGMWAGPMELGEGKMLILPLTEAPQGRIPTENPDAEA